MGGLGEAYRNHGLSGLALLGTARILRDTGTWLSGAAAALARRAAPVIPPDTRYLEANKEFKGRHAGQRCFVIGNGPSLAAQDLTPLKNELTFVMSGFWRHPVVRTWQPTYYFFADPLFFDGSEAMSAFFAQLRAAVHSTTFFLPGEAREALRRGTLVPPDQARFVEWSGRLSNGLPTFPDLSQPLPAVMSVSQFAIMGAMYMDCSPIYLLGLDHDWLAHRGMDRHFYQGKTIENHAAAHGDLGRMSYKIDLQCQLDLWTGYEFLLAAAKAKGIRIVNATNGGFLDVFERARYEEVLRQ
jgi:hypothetical protein